MYKNKAITLVEIVASISLMVLISSIVVIPIHINNKSEKIIDSFYRDVIYVRNLSMVNNINSYIRLSHKDNCYYLNTGSDIPEIEVKFSPVKLKSCELVYDKSEIRFNRNATLSYTGHIDLEYKTLFGTKNCEITLVPATGNVNLYYGEKDEK